LTAAYQPLEQQVANEIRRQLAAAEADAADVPGGGRLVTLLTAIRQPLRIEEMFARQDVLLELLYLDVGDAADWRRALAESAAAERDAFDQLTGLPPGSIANAAAALQADPATQAVRDAVQRTIGGDVMRFANGEPDWRRYGPTLRFGLEYIDRITAFVISSAGAVRAAAADVQAAAIDELQLGLTFGAFLAVLTLVACVLLARSISRPLRRLALQAEIVRHGDLNVPALPARGPHDIAVTSRAVNDLVDNLRLLEAKTHALAELDFDADALAQPLPGPLGESLQRSVSVLSGSVAERDELRAHLVHQATHDGLTGLHSRASAVDAVEQALDRARRIHRGVAAILVDLHGFKLLNDTYGARTGDDILVAVAGRLARAAGDAGLVARLGGDEFLVMVEDVEDADPVTRLAHHVLNTVSGEVRLAGAAVNVAACAGIAFCFDGGAAADQLMAWADLALARAKPRGPGAVEIYDRGLQEQLQQQAAVEKALTHGIADDELFLQYQPVIDLATGRMTSAEALVRWDRPGTGLQPPDSFIPVAERSNLILTLDQWVLDRACRQMHDWRTSPALLGLTVAVNVSGRHLASGSLHGRLADLLARTGVDPGRVIVEITETVLVDDLVRAAAQLQAIRGLGLRVALDDFGTGFTSLAHLQQLPVDIIKLDRSFVARIGGERDRALIAMLTQLGHQLGHTITAEGVETAEQYELLHDLGCDHAQGYLMSRPLVPRDLQMWAAEKATAAP
jgi:diguanylate cyclase (GGDEF)-like protein